MLNLKDITDLTRTTIERLAREKGQLEIDLLEARAEYGLALREIAALKATNARLVRAYEAALNRLGQAGISWPEPIATTPVRLNAEAWRA